MANSSINASSSGTTMPVAFLAHGSPMSAIENNIFTQDWHKLCKDFPRPKAIVIFSAHWKLPATVIQAQSQQETIHDFGGFPQALYDCQYPAKGSPELAAELHNTLQQAGFNSLLENAWGLDHGSWSLLTHLYPDADIPCLQISLNSSFSDLQQHFDLAKSLQRFRDEGVLFIGSGNIVHNIEKWLRGNPGDDISWAQDFDTAVFKAVKERNFSELFNYQNLPGSSDSVPTDEHFLPLLYILGLTTENDEISTSDFAVSDLASASSRSVVFKAT